MRAIVLREHGGLDKLALETGYPDPVPGEDDVIVRVRACALNYHDVFTRKGMPGIGIPLPVILGNDAAGDIVDVGSKVTGFSVGDRVLIDPLNRQEHGLMGEVFDGGLAEYVRVPAHMLIALDPLVSYEQAAALPVAYGTAFRMIRERGRLQPGELVLVLGASGGVGTCCVQLAKQAGATVIACASSDEKLECLERLGADFGINYAKADWVEECRRRFGRPRIAKQGEGGVDVVVNFTGGDTWAKSLRVMKRNGRLLTCGATAGYNPVEDIRYIWTFELNIIGSNGWSNDDVRSLLSLVHKGDLKPVIHHERFSLDRGIDAMRELENRTTYGKVIIHQ